MSRSLQTTKAIAPTPVLHSCRPCGGSMVIPNLSEGSKVVVGTLARSKRLSEVLHYLKLVGVSAPEAKFIALHTTRMKGVCHRCYYPLEMSNEGECLHCGAVNLDW